MKELYFVTAKDRATACFGQLVKLSNGIHVFLEKRGREWSATELLTGLLVPLKDENKKRCTDCLWELNKIQELIYNSVRGIFSSTSVRQLKPIMTRRGWAEDELNDICYYAKYDYYDEFLNEYKRLCKYALEWSKGIGKEEQK